MQFIYSTPKRFVDAVRAENVEWPAYRADFFPYQQTDRYLNFWSGFYSTRPNFKVQVKEASKLYHASARAFALQVIDERTSE